MSTPGPNLAFRHDSLSYSSDHNRPVDIILPAPPMGGKIWLLDRKGLFVLERGPGTIRTLAVTHAGAGALEAIDGVPNDDGFFPGGHMVEPHVQHYATFPEYAAARQAFDTRNGRPIYSAPAGVMGSWMLDGGFRHGLTIRTLSGHQSVAATASIVWVAFKQRSP